MFEALETLPAVEVSRRHASCRALLAERLPRAGGMLVFSRLALYYLTGTFGNGVLWLPQAGEPVLMIRKGMERARLESPLGTIAPFRSYGDLAGICKELGAPLSPVVAAEMGGLSWQLSSMLTARVPEVEFVGCDAELAKAQSVKSEWELEKMRLCGARHAQAMCRMLPETLRPGMTEREASHLIWQAFFSLGHQGVMRMSSQGEEIFLGHIAAGDSGNYPSVFNGPLGLRGEHPAVPFMGYAGKVWRKGEPLTVDCGFSLEGYTTDKTQVYWAGPHRTIPEPVLSAHGFCMDVQAYVAERLKPGEVPSEIWSHCRAWADRQGFGDGFMGLAGNKVPFLGHGIGLAIDGYPVLAKGFDQPLQAGMVMAVEPKQGIPGVGMVGVENTFEVTASGGRCLTGDRFDMLCVE